MSTRIAWFVRVWNMRWNSCAPWLWRAVARGRPVMDGRAANLPAGVELHDLDRFAVFDRAVVQGDRSDATERCDGLKMQRRVRGEPALEVGPQRVPTAHLSMRRAESGRDRRDESDVVAIVRQDPVDVVGIPRFDPFVFEFGDYASLGVPMM